MIEELEINPSNYYKTKAYLMKTTIDLTNNNACSTQRKHKEYATKGTSNKERSSKVRTRKVSNNREYIKGNKEDEAVDENDSNNKGLQFQTQTKEKRNKERKERKEKDRNDNHALYKAVYDFVTDARGPEDKAKMELEDRKRYKKEHGVSPHATWRFPSFPRRSRHGPSIRRQSRSPCKSRAANQGRSPGQSGEHVSRRGRSNVDEDADDYIESEGLIDTNKPTKDSPRLRKRGPSRRDKSEHKSPPRKLESYRQVYDKDFANKMD